MTKLPGGEDTLLVRTNFSDDTAWQRLRAEVATENADGFRAYVQVVDDAAWTDASSESVREAATAGEGDAAVLFVVDAPALGDGFPIQVVDLSDEARAPFRCLARELWSVDNNLNLANMDWEEFADQTDPDGVYRGSD